MNVRRPKSFTIALTANVNCSKWGFNVMKKLTLGKLISPFSDLHSLCLALSDEELASFIEKHFKDPR